MAQYQRPPFIAVRDVMKRYDDKVVLDDIDLTIERGETVAIIGGSGSGKSTLARILVGLERPTSGSILVDGVDITTLDDFELAAVRRRFAMVFQRHALLDSLTVFDNVAFPLREAEHMPAREVRPRVERVLRELGVEAAAHKLPGELSGGMAKRVGIARAMVMQPELLVYDEPTSGLDPVNSRIVDGLIERMRSEHMVTSVVITHDMVTAYRISDRIALLANGRIVAEGTPEAFLVSHQETVREFARASGMDVARLGPRMGRVTPEAVREAWDRAHPPGS